MKARSGLIGFLIPTHIVDGDPIMELIRKVEVASMVNYIDGLATPPYHAAQ